VTSTFNIGAVSGDGNVFGDNARVRQTTGGVPGRAGPEDAGPTHPAPGRPDGHPGRGAESADARRLGEQEILELARLYPSARRARTLLRRAGFRTEWLPVFEASANPHEYWREISEQMGHGIAVHGRRRLLAVALSDYPHNPVFLERVGGTSTELGIPG
jgi:hypothetical protein